MSSDSEHARYVESVCAGMVRNCVIGARRWGRPDPSRSVLLLAQQHRNGRNGPLLRSGVMIISLIPLLLPLYVLISIYFL